MKKDTGQVTDEEMMEIAKAAIAILGLDLDDVVWVKEAQNKLLSELDLDANHRKRLTY